MVSTLYVVSSPIGNLQDVSPRAAEVLRTVSRVLAEDTRRTAVLTRHVGSTARLVSVHQHNEHARVAAVIDWLGRGEALALVTDAGTPLVSDPGGVVVRAAIEAGHDVVPVPGPSAVLAALIGAGLTGERFTFLGFLQRKGGERERELSAVCASPYTSVLFESPHRLARLLRDLSETCGADRPVAVARELTKLHEEFRRGTVGELARYYEEHAVKGEVTVVVAGRSPDPSEEVDRERVVATVGELLGAGERASAVAKEIAERFGLARNEAYRIVQEIRGSALGPEASGTSQVADDR